MNTRRLHEVMDTSDPMNQEVEVWDDGVSLQDLGNHIRAQNYNLNIDITENIPHLTEDISSLDVIDALNCESLNETQIKDSFAALCLMINRLMAENRYLLKEIQALKTNYSREGVNRFNNLVFRKRNIEHQYTYPGTNMIPTCNLNELIKNFDLNTTRKNEGSINTLRRFVRFILENVIPQDLHTKFTLRERSGVDTLLELPLDLVNIIKDICLESVHMLDVSTDDDKERREDLGNYLIQFIKYALQEMRRTPRKSKQQRNLEQRIKQQQQQQDA